MTPLRAFTTVYSYYLPEVRAAISRLTADYPHDVFLRSVAPGGLDDFHQPVLDRVVSTHAHDVPALAGFAFRYPTAGSEEGIREYLSLLAVSGVKSVYMLRGDYEGYREVAKTRGIETVEVEIDTPPSSLAPGHFFLSDPSARDGNRLDPAVPQAIAEAGHQLFYDLSYLGSTGPAVFDVSHPNVAAVAVSFSKTFGLFYYRIGFLFTRAAVPALYANKWFKNVFGLMVAERVLRDLDLAAIAAKYKGVQAEILAEIHREHGLGLRPSDSFLLAHLPVSEAGSLAAGVKEDLARFRRHTAYRFCLTPYFMERAG